MELIDRIGAWEKLRAWAEAGQLAEIADIALRRRHTDELERADRGGHGAPGQLMEFVVDEIALAARTSRVAAAHRLDLAHDLTGTLPAVFTALQTHSIDLIRSRISTEGTAASTNTSGSPSPTRRWPKPPPRRPARRAPRSPEPCTFSIPPEPRKGTRPT
ncbi:MAG: hypothetical protein H0T40_13525 [Geodermatophilaceae bacterium]|nr:hypothetical protein [Geodermatophilaceae bacterium]